MAAHRKECISVCFLGVGAAALLVFLTGAAGTRIVTTNFRGAANDLLHRLHITRAGHARLFQLAAFFALEGFFEIVHRCSNATRRAATIAVGTTPRPKDGNTSFWAALTFRSSAWPPHDA